MAVVEETVYRASCDCCGEVANEDYSQATEEDALNDAVDVQEYKIVDGELLCSDCWIDEEDMVGYEGGSNIDYVPMRRHATHNGPNLEWQCQSIHPESDVQCILRGEHTVHSAHLDNGPDWSTQ